MSIIKAQRHLFDIPKEIAYFNCAYNGPLLNQSVQELNRGVKSKSQPWNIKAADFFDDTEKVRILSSEIFGGNSNNYSIIPAASYGISTAARIIEPFLKKDQQILLMEDEFPSVVLPLIKSSEMTGAKIVTVKTPENGNWTEAILSQITNQIKVVAISSCHWTNGAFIDLVKIRNECNKAGSILIIDGTQSLGAVPFSMDIVKPDFFVAAGYKWLLSPYGFSLFYVDKKWHDYRPLEETWLARENSENFAELASYSGIYKKGARRFDVGETCKPTILPGAISALEQISKWGVEHISDSLLQINKIIGNHLEALGFSLMAEKNRNPHILGAIIPKNENYDFVNILRNKNIYISQRGNSIRFAPHLHITDYDIERLVLALYKI